MRGLGLLNALRASDWATVAAIGAGFVLGVLLSALAVVVLVVQGVGLDF